MDRVGEGDEEMEKNDESAGESSELVGLENDSAKGKAKGRARASRVRRLRHLQSSRHARTAFPKARLKPRHQPLRLSLLRARRRPRRQRTPQLVPRHPPPRPKSQSTPMRSHLQRAVQRRRRSRSLQPWCSPACQVRRRMQSPQQRGRLRPKLRQWPRLSLIRLPSTARSRLLTNVSNRRLRRRLGCR